MKYSTMLASLGFANVLAILTWPTLIPKHGPFICISGCMVSLFAVICCTYLFVECKKKGW